MAIMNGIQRPVERWDWAGTNWVRMRQRVTAAMHARPAPQLPPKPAAQAKTDEYVWGKEKPAGFREGETVLPALVKKAVSEALLVAGDDRGLVTVGGSSYIVEKKVAPATGTLPTTKSGESGLGRFRESVIFAPEYQRVAEKVLRDVEEANLSKLHGSMLYVCAHLKLQRALRGAEVPSLVAHGAVQRRQLRAAVIRVSAPRASLALLRRARARELRLQPLELI